MAASYDIAYPPEIPLIPNLDQFLQAYLNAADTPTEPERYAREFFTENAVMAFGPSKVPGQEGNGTNSPFPRRLAPIRSYKIGETTLWKDVKSSRHEYHKVFPFGPYSKEMMVIGSVKAQMKDGETTREMDFAGHIQLAEVDGKLRMENYKTWIVT
ncbi:MAG: hypothetical protein M4579_007341 [Chaenotheca gracillima]|nr:MAG: hypothetical protein M4579_007341 [Chaenotheca gracillima]